MIAELQLGDAFIVMPSGVVAVHFTMIIIRITVIVILIIISVIAMTVL